MINLLPKEGRVNLKHLYRGRFAIVVLCFSNFIFLVSVAFLLPSLFSLIAKKQTVVHAIEIAKSRPVSKEASDLGELIKNTNLQVKLLSPVSTSTIPFTEIIDEILLHKGSSVALTQVGEINKGHILLRGNALSRSGLLAFIKDLDLDPMFKEVQSPISNLIANTNIDFSVDLELVQKNDVRE
ncbi:MAG TPA: hypothetical protein VJK09_02185 [Candidatus Paceibacterota bacterium]